ncbi:MAG: transcriptional regulator [Deltaproteobacteria bacterium]|nr:MAG: transcriptional regulator [Deltaproteobacteria bacterium]
MAFPSKKELERVRKKLAKAEPTYALPLNATQVEKLKFLLCREMISYLLSKKITQNKFAERLDIDPARVSEIVKYKIDLFTVDRLLTLVEKLNPTIKITMA